MYLTFSASTGGAGLAMVFHAKRDCTSLDPPLFPSLELSELVLSFSDLQESDVLDAL